jgi:aryl sulfotransferase
VGKIVWLDSYPKSGNTWVRFVVTSLLTGRNTFPEDNRSMFDDVNEVIPDVDDPNFSFEKYATTDRVFLKSHEALKDGEPASRARLGIPTTTPTERAVYIVRNPLDMVASTWNHLCVNQGEEPPVFADLFKAVSERGEFFPGDDQYGKWDQHVDSWTKQPTAFPLLVLRYEDLLADAVGSFQKVAEFLQIDCRPARVREAVESFSFQRLRAREDELVRLGAETRFQKKGRKAGFRFFNEGRPATHKTMLTPEQAEMVRARFARTMAELGY